MTGAEKHRFGDWETECEPSDGGRLTLLRWRGRDLLTPPPRDFRAPQKDFGMYETRPVFGYDDCFPSVDPCENPATGGKIPDHGSLCWRKWAVSKESGALEFVTDCELPKTVFRRRMEFDADSLKWVFSVENTGPDEAVFMHVAHALLPLEDVEGVRLPAFAGAYDEAADRIIRARTPDEIQGMLSQTHPLNFKMLILRGVEEGFFAVDFRGGLSLEVSFPKGLFNSLAIWWNNGGHPAEQGLGRRECALEPLTGNFSSLERNVRDERFLSVGPGRTLRWETVWKMTLEN